MFQFDVLNKRFFIANQDHTMGTMLCDALNRDPTVTSCGYKVHEDNMEIMVNSHDPVASMKIAVEHILKQIACLQSSMRSQQHLYT